MLAWSVAVALVDIAVIVPAVTVTALAACGITIPGGTGAVLASKTIHRGGVGEALDQGEAGVNTSNPRGSNIAHSGLRILMDTFCKTM